MKKDNVLVLEKGNVLVLKRDNELGPGDRGTGTRVNKLNTQISKTII